MRADGDVILGGQAPVQRNFLGEEADLGQEGRVLARCAAEHRDLAAARAGQPAVTTPGRITTCFIMGIGVLTLAVITAQVASSFVAQGPGKARSGPQPEPAAPEVTLAELGQRLARIEELITAGTTSALPRAAPAPERESGGDSS